MSWLVPTTARNFLKAFNPTQTGQQSPLSEVGACTTRPDPHEQTTTRAVKFDFRPPTGLPSPLKEMIDELDEMIDVMDGIFSTQIPKARQQLGDLIKSCSALVVKAPIELKALGFDMVDCAEKVFASRFVPKCSSKRKIVFLLFEINEY